MQGLEIYKGLVRKAYALLTAPTIQWKVVKDAPRVQWFAENGEYFKMEARLPGCDLRRIFRLLADHHWVTRSQWDASMREMSVLECYERLEDGSIYAITRNKPDFVGVEWVREPSVVIRHSTQGPLIIEGIWVKMLDDKVFLTLISNEKELLLFDPAPYEQLAKDSVRYLKIYSPWTCFVCRKQVPCHELECRGCKTPRYKRCPNMQCFEAQMERATVCNYCGQSI